MAENGYQYIANRMPKLLPVLDANYSLSSLLQSFYANLAHQCGICGIDPADVVVSHVAVTEDRIVADIRFRHSAPTSRAGSRGLFQRSRIVEQMLRRNQSARQFLFIIVQGLANWARWKHITLEEVNVTKALLERSSWRLVAFLMTPKELNELMSSRKEPEHVYETSA